MPIKIERFEVPEIWGSKTSNPKGIKTKIPVKIVINGEKITFFVNVLLD